MAGQAHRVSAGAGVKNRKMPVRVDQLRHKVAVCNDAPRPRFLLYRNVPYSVDRPAEIVLQISSIDQIVDLLSVCGMPRIMLPGPQNMLECAGYQRIEHVSAGYGDDDPFVDHPVKQGGDRVRMNARFPRDSRRAFRIHER